MNIKEAWRLMPQPEKALITIATIGFALMLLLGIASAITYSYLGPVTLEVKIYRTDLEK